MPTGMIKGLGMKFTAALQRHPLLCWGRAPGRMRRPGTDCVRRRRPQAWRRQANGSAARGPPAEAAYGRYSASFWLFLLVQSLLVQCFGRASRPSPGACAGHAKEADQPKKAAAGAPAGARDPLRQRASCRARCADMREAILGAVDSGRIEELRHAWELNELKPDLGVELAGGDPVAHWKQISGDGEGREILAALGRDPRRRLRRAAARPRPGEQPDLRVALLRRGAARQAHAPPRRCELLRLVPPAAAKEMRATGKYTHWRLAIGADGTWHSFRRGP